MPEMDGYEASRLIRKESSLSTLPIIAMTSHAMVEERQRCLDSGMNDHIAKPIDQEVMLATMIKWYKPRTTHPLRLSSAVPANENEAIEVPNIPGIDVQSGLRRVSDNKILVQKTAQEIWRRIRARCIQNRRGIARR